MRRLLLALLAGLLLASGVEAQDRELERALSRVAELWSRGDATGVVRFAAPAGLSLEIEGDALGPLDRRQAEAALRHLFQLSETVEIRRSMAGAVPGEPERAYGELAWLSRPRGATVPDRAIVFIGLTRQEDGWRITQIRIMK